MAHTFTIELSDHDIDALCARFEYQAFVPDRSAKGPAQRQKAIPNPITPEQFAQGIIEGFIDKTTDEHVARDAAENAARAAIETHRASYPRARDRANTQ